MVAKLTSVCTGQLDERRSGKLANSSSMSLWVAIPTGDDT